MNKCANVLGVLGVFVSLALFSSGAALAAEPDCSREAGSLPDTARAAGVASREIPIEHIVVAMEENHSFDNFFGRLNKPEWYGDELDGITPEMFNPDGKGANAFAHHEQAYCVKNTEHSWDSSHRQWNDGRNDGFVTENGGGKSGARAMGYYDDEDLRYLYEMANRFSVADRYFSSLLGPTFPNRSYFYAASSFGHVRNNFRIPTEFPTIFEQLSRHHVSWKYYYTDISIALLMRTFSKDQLKHFAHVSQYRRDLAKGELPAVSYLEVSYLFGEEHPPFNFQIGQRQLAGLINELLNSTAWPTSALFVTYDEHGGYFDHVAPPKACAPDAIAPILGGKDKFKAGFDQLGFRVPFVAISPYAKRHHVSHVTYDHTSVLKFIETKFNLPALTRRDANADALLDLFDFTHGPEADFPVPPLPDSEWKKCLGHRVSGD